MKDGEAQALIPIGRALLYQQLWCWGQDICHPGGNVLRRYGFLAQRPAHPDRGGTAYVLDACPERTLVLWGFGVFYGDDAGGGEGGSTFHHRALDHAEQVSVGVARGRAVLDRVHPRR